MSGLPVFDGVAVRRVARSSSARRILLLGVTSALAAAGCDGNAGVVETEPTRQIQVQVPMSVTVSPSTGTIAVGGTLQLEADVRDQFGQPMVTTVRWRSSSADVGTVTQTGLLTGQAPGVVSITARAGVLIGPTGSGTYTITVVAPPPGPPGTVTNLAATGAGNTSLTLSFTEVGDGAGAPADYEVRFRNAGSGNWDSSLLALSGSCAYPVQGNAVGAQRTCAIEGLESGRSYDVQVAAFRESGGSPVMGAPSNTVTASTTTPPSNSPPATPGLSVSAITASGATLNGSAFADPNSGDTHAASEWQVDEQGGDWSSLVANSGVTTANLTSFAVGGLAASTNYQARARYRDNHSAWSPWSVTQSFATAAAPPPNTAPNAPTLSTGNVTATGATLSGTAFSDPDAGNTHSASEWQIDEQGGDWSSPVANSGVTTSNLTSFAATGLTASTSYQTRARYRDNNNAWSAWSASHGFTTAVATLNISTTSLPNGTVNAPYSQTVVASGGSGGYSWSLTAGGLPPGLNLSPGTGVISGTPIASGTANFTVRVQSGDAQVDTQPLSIAVSAPPPPGSPTFVWSSDWSTATGVSTNALMDGGRWNVIGGEGNEVIAAGGLGFPAGMTNVLRVTATAERSGYSLLRTTQLPALQVGEVRYYRWYNRMEMPDYNPTLSDQETHPHQDGNAASDSNWLYHIYHDGASGDGANRWLAQLRFGSPTVRYVIGNLVKGQVYRFEVRIERVSSTQYRASARVYNPDGSLSHGPDQILRDPGSGGTGTSLADAPLFTFSNTNGLTGFNAGLNGLGGSEWHPSQVYMYQGGIAVCAQDWCGPYAPGQGR